MDEHRIGLKPIARGVWAPKGQRPIALGHHRFEWLYVAGFAEPLTGRTVWNIAEAISKEMFELMLAGFAKSTGAGHARRIVLQPDNAGWHGPVDDRRALMTKLLKEGYQVKDVAKAAAVTPMTVYRHMKTPEMLAWFRQPDNLMTLYDVTDPNPVAATKEDFPAGFFESTDDKKPSRRKKK